ncbi:metalloregulator ArsR/SmtB family transcription factor [Streptomyces sp. NPDC048251]|uniref:ArsR/SmtB family transcription factor n=1 Tax=Streptomyces sp. NPDC048251 TaxID=3154501 RepID=UPI003421D4B8
MSREAIAPPEGFKALGDPIRWSIIQQMAEQDELACSLLEDTLPVSKPTISYHTKILAQAGLIEVRKRGRNYFYTLRRDVLRDLIDELWTMAPGPRLVGESSTPAPHRTSQTELKAAVGDDTPQPAPLLTW